MSLTRFSKSRIPLRRIPVNFRKDYRKTWNDTRDFLNGNRWKCLGSLLTVLLLSVFLVNPFDRTLLEEIRGDSAGEEHRLLASRIGRWGDFLQFNLAGSTILWCAGYLLASRWLQRLAHVALFAAILAGATCNVFRFTVGRPRPHAKEADGVYGIPGTLSGWRFHGFPSGHTSTAFGSAVPLAAVAGPWAAPAVGFAGLVGWSRLYSHKHYPSDVLVGAAIGTIFGMASGWRLRKARLRLLRRRRDRARRESRRWELAAPDPPVDPAWSPALTCLRRFYSAVRTRLF